MKKFLRGDQFRSRQVLLNLLQNAIKFTSEGFIRVNVHVVSEDEHLQRIKISIIDTGIGIEAGVLSLLFNQFVQADSSTTRKFGGTGLGLVIVKQLVELMGGSVVVESTPGKGSTFSLEIPFKKTEKEDPFLNTERKIEGNIILLVHNNFEREWYKKAFETLGARVVAESPGFETESVGNIKKTIQEKNAICVIDSGFEEVNRELLESLSSDGQTRIIHIRHAHDGHKHDVKQIDGCVVYNKPVMSSDIRKIMEHYFLNQELQGYIKKNEMAPNTVENYQCNILLVEDSPTNQIVAKKLLEKIGYLHITTSNNGKEAIQVLENDTFDLIFMDCQMPEIDGFKATEIIRDRNSNVKDHSVFIIAFTAHAMQEEIQKCFLSGMNDYVLKPVTIDSLKSVLKRWNDSRKGRITAK